MTTDLLNYVIPALLTIVVSALAGGLTAWWLLHRRQASDPPEPTPAKFADAEFMDAEIDLASVAWAEASNLPPEAVGLMAARLKTLHMIGKGKGWF